MSTGHVRGLAWVGLACAVLSSAGLGTLLVIGNSIDEHMMQVWSFAMVATPVLAIATGALAGLVLPGMRESKLGYRLTIPALAGLAAIVGCFAEYWLATSLFWPPFDDAVYYPNGKPYDWAPLTVTIAGAVLYLIAATIYGFAGQAQGVKVGARTGLLVLLLLAMVPFANILSLAGLTIVTYARASPNGRFLRVRGESTRQY